MGGTNGVGAILIVLLRVTYFLIYSWKILLFNYFHVMLSCSIYNYMGRFGTCGLSRISSGRTCYNLLLWSLHMIMILFTWVGSFQTYCFVVFTEGLFLFENSICHSCKWNFSRRHQCSRSTLFTSFTQGGKVFWRT